VILDVGDVIMGEHEFKNETKQEGKERIQTVVGRIENIVDTNINSYNGRNMENIPSSNLTFDIGDNKLTVLFPKQMTFQEGKQLIGQVAKYTFTSKEVFMGRMHGYDVSKTYRLKVLDGENGPFLYKTL
jgi:hypothetical protein